MFHFLFFVTGYQQVNNITNYDVYTNSLHLILPPIVQDQVKHTKISRYLSHHTSFVELYKSDYTNDIVVQKLPSFIYRNETLMTKYIKAIYEKQNRNKSINNIIIPLNIIPYNGMMLAYNDYKTNNYVPLQRLGFFDSKQKFEYRPYVYEYIKPKSIYHIFYTEITANYKILNQSYIKKTNITGEFFIDLNTETFQLQNYLLIHDMCAWAANIYELVYKMKAVKCLDKDGLLLLHIPSQHKLNKTLVFTSETSGIISMSPNIVNNIKIEILRRKEIRQKYKFCTTKKCYTNEYDVFLINKYNEYHYIKMKNINEDSSTLKKLAIYFTNIELINNRIILFVVDINSRFVYKMDQYLSTSKMLWVIENNSQLGIDTFNHKKLINKGEVIENVYTSRKISHKTTLLPLINQSSGEIMCTVDQNENDVTVGYCASFKNNEKIIACLDIKKRCLNYIIKYNKQLSYVWLASFINMKNITEFEFQFKGIDKDGLKKLISNKELVYDTSNNDIPEIVENETFQFSLFETKLIETINEKSYTLIDTTKDVEIFRLKKNYFFVKIKRVINQNQNTKISAFIINSLEVMYPYISILYIKNIDNRIIFITPINHRRRATLTPTKDIQMTKKRSGIIGVLKKNQVNINYYHYVVNKKLYPSMVLDINEFIDNINTFKNNENWKFEKIQKVALAKIQKKLNNCNINIFQSINIKSIDMGKIKYDPHNNFLKRFSSKCTFTTDILDLITSNIQQNKTYKTVIDQICHLNVEENISMDYNNTYQVIDLKTTEGKMNKIRDEL